MQTCKQETSVKFIGSKGDLKALVAEPNQACSGPADRGWHLEAGYFQNRLGSRNGRLGKLEAELIRGQVPLVDQSRRAYLREVDSLSPHIQRDMDPCNPACAPFALSIHGLSPPGLPDRRHDM